MKNNFTRFTKRNKHKRRNKEAIKNELIAAIRDTGVGYDSLKLRTAIDAGRRARDSKSPHRDEIAIKGIFSSSKGGFGFVSTDDGGRDIFIPEGKCAGAIDGDTVSAVYHTFIDRDGNERTEGRVTDIIEYGRTTLIGTLKRERYGRRAPYFCIIPDDPRLYIRPVVMELSGAREGEKVIATLLRGKSPVLTAKITACLGESESKEANYAAILADCGIVTEFSEEELAIAANAAAEEVVTEGRADLTGEIIFTIDGAGAKDLDDAVSLKRLDSGGYRLGVHIADVSHYVKEKTALDRAVMARGTSVYFTDKVVPMLPRELSNGACSLNAGEPKYTLSALIDLDSEGEIVSLKLVKAVIISRVRGVYSEINSIFDGNPDTALNEKYGAVMPTLTEMRQLYEILRKKSIARGSLDFDAPEAEIVLGEDGFPKDIYKRERGLSERIIEQFMLTANEAVATELNRAKIPCVYRIHEEPPPDKFAEFVEYAHNLGFDSTEITKDNPSPRALIDLLKSADERGLLLPVSRTMLRSMAKAKYSAVRAGHFGLGIDTYCHFTSPIRRLSDLATHRIIERVLFDGKNPDYYKSYANRAAAAATEGELRALSAERRIENLYKVIYMSASIGKTFSATVSSVTAFGMFAELENTCEGLIPISELEGMFFFDEKTLSLRSRKANYRIGDRIAVRLEEADIIRGKLRFSLLEEL